MIFSGCVPFGKADTKPKPKKTNDKEQSERFRKPARELGADQSMEEFEHIYEDRSASDSVEIGAAFLKALTQLTCFSSTLPQ
jgi:hypothetical protein